MEKGALSALTYLNLYSNNLSSELPPELGNLMSLTALFLDNGSFSGNFPFFPAKLTILYTISLHNNNFATDGLPSDNHYNKERVQSFLTTNRRRKLIHYLMNGITTTNCHRPIDSPPSLFSSLCQIKDVIEIILGRSPRSTSHPWVSILKTH